MSSIFYGNIFRWKRYFPRYVFIQAATFGKNKDDTNSNSPGREKALAMTAMARKTTATVVYYPTYDDLVPGAVVFRACEY